MSDMTLERQQQAAPTDPLLEPFRLKGLKLRNRIVSTSHASMLDDGGMPLERYQRYHEEKARGGLAMTMMGGSAMASPDSSWGGGQLDLSTDCVIPHLRSLAERIHRHGAAVISQVSHLGRRATAYGGNWLPAVAPSRIREIRNRNFPREMDESDINRIARDYASAALRCRDGGLDGVETVTGGHLIGQFLSPYTNKRTDGFGGTLENRARFGLMVHEAIRKAVGDEMIVGIRFVIDEGVEGGSNFEDCVELARLFEEAGTLDYFNCIYGRMDTELALSEDNMPGIFQRSAPFLSHVAAFRREIRLPLIHAAGIRDVATARHAIREDIVDLVGMTRAHIADPDIVNKITAGAEGRIRPCVGATYCLYKKVNCIHNPASGRETVLSHKIPPADRPAKVVVVGGGPAGMEAARVSAERGHSVVLMEAAAKLGGQILVATAIPERHDLIGIVAWRASELERLGVDVRLNVYADAETVMAEQPEIVLVATGGVPDLAWLNGAELCDSVWDALTGTVPGKKDILIYDGTGRQSAVSCALKLAREGRAVRIATPDEALAMEMSYPDKVGFRKRLAQLGVECTPYVRLHRVAGQDGRLFASFRHELTAAEIQMSADQIVVENGTTPADELFYNLKSTAANNGVTDIGFVLGRNETLEPSHQPGLQLHRIGDAVSSRDIYSSIQEAYRLCCRI